jgi:RNA recognition motif-containing protein
MNLYVSNLDINIKNEDLQKLFSSHGEVASVEVVTDVFTEKSRGFAYIEMPNEAQALKAIDSLNSSELSNQKITVQVAKPKENYKGSYKVGNGIVKSYRFRKN